MKATIFDGSSLTFERNYPEPDVDECMVRITMAGICGTDLEILDGYMDYQGILGHEFVGVIEKSKNKELIGKRVVGEINVGCQKCDSCKNRLSRHCPNRTVLGILDRSGAFAEYLSLPEKNLHLIPDSVTDQQAVFIEPLAAAFEIKEQIKIDPNWKVAVIGDGRLSQLITPVLSLTSKEITCFDKHADKLKRLENYGIKTKIGIKEYDKRQYDLVVEATGSESGFEDTIKLVRPKVLSC